MRSLSLKLTLAFLVISLTGAVLAAVFSRQATVREFDRFVLDKAQANFMAQVAAYYQTTSSWVGAADFFRRLAQNPPLQPPNASSNPVHPPPVFPLADQSGQVVVPGGPYRLGDRVPAAELRRGVAVYVDGQTVGVMLIPKKPPTLDPREEQYLERTNQALLKAALGATAIAILLGFFLARTLTRPLRELTTATRAVAKGELQQTVPVRSQDELGELAAAFNQMSADLAYANQARRQMTADIAHDLRTPLTVITGYLEGLRDGVLQPTPARFEIVYQEAEHLKHLVEDLRTLSLADAGELRLSRQPVSPRDLLERAAEAHRLQAEGQQIALGVKASPDLPEIQVDPDRMMQVLGNLVSNALRHTPEGGQIVLSAQGQTEAVLLTVQDTGEGIPPGVLPRVFERFYRGDASRQQHKGESGLGLAIAKSIVEAHGGKIEAASEGAGRGSTFTIRLPLLK